MSNNNTDLLLINIKNITDDLRKMGNRPTPFSLAEETQHIQALIERGDKLLTYYAQELQLMHIENQIEFVVYMLQHVINLGVPPLYLISKFIPALSLNQFFGLQYGGTYLDLVSKSNSMASLSFFNQESLSKSFNFVFHPTVDRDKSIALLNLYTRRSISSFAMSGMSINIGLKLSIVDNKLSMYVYGFLGHKRADGFGMGPTYAIDLLNFGSNVTSSTPSFVISLLLVVLQYVKAFSPICKQIQEDKKSYQRGTQYSMNQVTFPRNQYQQVVRTLYTNHPELREKESFFTETPENNHTFRP